MAGPEFFQTVMGRAFFEGTIPSLVREMKKLNENLARIAPATVAAADAVYKPKMGSPPGWHTDFVKGMAIEAQKSGEAAGRLVGTHLLELLEDHTNGHKSDEMKHMNLLIEELKGVEAFAAEIRRNLQQEL